MADAILSDQSIALVKAANLPISLAAVELIVAEEDTGENFYNKHYEHPEWPGGASGVTILLGYDLGYATRAKVIHDLQGKIPDAMLNACLSVTGLTGSRAASALAGVKNKIAIPFTVALDVFLHNDMPEWIATVRHSLPNTEVLPPDCLGMLTSLTYNRGASFNNSGDRYREMRAIKDDMVAQNFDDIPNQFRLMARLWPSTSGVYKRRFHEATLFEQGLRSITPSTTPPAPVRDTKWLQASLNAMGENPPLVVDGSYGKKTADAVQRFQTANHLLVDGIAGKVTIATLAEKVVS